VKSHPTAWWWLKADGCDLVKGLKESVKLKWSGDVDLNDGELQEQYNTYIGHLESVKKAGLVQEHASVELKRISEDLAKDLQYVQSGIQVKCIVTIILD